MYLQEDGELMDQSSEKERLSALLADALTSEGPSPELLARYAADPNSLSSEERAQVEAELARASSTAAREVAVLRNFDLEAVLAESQSDATPQAPPRQLGGLSRLRDRLAASPWLVWAPVGAVAILAAVLLVPRRGLDPTAPAETGTTVAQAPEQAVPEVLNDPPPVPSEVPEQVAPAPEFTEPRVPTRPDSPSHEQQAAPVLLAMASPTYRAPTGALPRERATIVRGNGAGPELRALAPAHLARTASTQPTLYWWLDEAPEGPGRFVFSITAAEAIDPLVRTVLSTPRAAGVQALSLADHDARLEASLEYTWTVTFERDPDEPSRNPLAIAWIQLTEMESALRDALDGAESGQTPALLAEAGYWYDALSALDALKARFPDDPRVGTARNSLLKQIDLPGL